MRTLPEILLLAVVTLPGVSCVQFKAKPLSAATSAAAFEGRTLADAGLQNRTLTLENLAPAALKLHPEIATAKAEAEAVKAAAKTAATRPNPSASFIPTRVANPAAGDSPWLAGFTLDIPIETAGKRSRRMEHARELANAAVLRVAEASWKVRVKLRKAWLDLFAAERRSELLAAQLKSQEESVRLLESSVQAGESSRRELMQSRLLMIQSRLLAGGAKKSAAEARADLASALGIPAAALTPARFDFRSLENPARELATKRLRQGAFTQRSDVLAALADYAAAEAALRLEIAKQLPDVHLGPGYEFDQGLNKWSLGFTVPLPLFDRNRGPIAEAEAKRTAAAAKFHALEAKISGELDHALASYRGALEKLSTADELTADTKKQLDSAEAVIKAGEGGRLALLTAQVEHNAAALGRLDALIEAQQALGTLEDAAQTVLAR
jgi:outer membrane protein TolC